MSSCGSDGNAATISSPLRLAYGPASLQFGDLYVPKGSGPHPVVILIHGGFWRAAYTLALMQRLAGDLVEKSVAAWNIEYRRLGDPGEAGRAPCRMWHMLPIIWRCWLPCML